MYRHGDKVMFTEDRLKRAQERTLRGSSGIPTPSDSFILKHYGKPLTIKLVTQLAGNYFIAIEESHCTFNDTSVTMYHKPVRLPEELFTL
jgi:hypothetical protein